MNFRLLLSIASILIAAARYTLVMGQTPQRFLKIQVDYGTGSRYTEEAVEYIDATSKVRAEAKVEYLAGKKVVLLPGFEAKTGSVFVANVRPVSATVEKGLELTAFPNPFEQTTTISYYLPANGKVNLWIVDTQGKLIHRLVDDQEQAAGKHEVKWEAGSASSGVYLPIVESNQQRVSGRIVKK